MLALVLSLYPDGKPDSAKAWVREYATELQKFLNSKVDIDGDVEGVRVQLTTDETVFERAAKRLRERDGLRRHLHALLGDAAEAARKDSRDLVTCSTAPRNGRLASSTSPSDDPSFTTTGSARSS